MLDSMRECVTHGPRWHGAEFGKALVGRGIAQALAALDYEVPAGARVRLVACDVPVDAWHVRGTVLAAEGDTLTVAWDGAATCETLLFAVEKTF